MNTRQRLLRRLTASTIVSLLVGVTAGWVTNAPSRARTFSLPSVTLARLESPPQFDAEVTSPPEWEQKPLATSESDQNLFTAQPDRARRTQQFLIAAIPHSLPITARPGGGRVIGQMPAGSRYFGVPHKAWIFRRSNNGRFGKVAVPYSASRATGWIRIANLKLSRTPFAVRVDLSKRSVTLTRRGKTIMRSSAAVGAPASPTPTGRYFVTDRVPADPSGPFGAFAFGISGIQPRLPAGWSGGDQLAIHGTNDPSSIGKAVSAGCPRVPHAALERLIPVLALGTPVVIKP